MIVGLPGAGISTLFYLLCVLVMPFRALWTVARGGRLMPGEGRRIVRQVTIALAILIAFGITGALLGAILPQSPAAPSTADALTTTGDAAPGVSLPRIIGPAAVVFAFVTLALVLGLVRLLTALLPRTSRTPLARPRVADVPLPRPRVPQPRAAVPAMAVPRREPASRPTAARRPVPSVPARET
jgi:hypothetical protein